MKAARQLNLDKIGAYASAICAVHCLLTGVALGLLSVVGLDFIGSTTSEVVFLSVAGVVGTTAVVHGIRKHGSFVPSLFFVGAIVCIVMSHFVFGHDHINPVGTVFAVAGGLAMVAFHLLNQRFHHHCDCRRCQHES